ncbi:MAG: ErfK/YbiS/YcfS/YnhG family protein [Cyanobacteria bacterium RYN_339]|nr:ErfK/YbiS/YcfS/YnhG family protein [Cyanobacteria bacterium RYN_339]
MPTDVRPIAPTRILTPARPAQPVAAQPAPAPAPAAFGQDSFQRQDRYKIEVDLPSSRLYVVDKATGEPVDRYLTSPGRKEFPTAGKHFTIQRTLLKAPWNPPASKWAANAKPVPGGMNNPMGIFKMDLGGYSEYIHGTPASERADLGRPASHGCMRLSNENVLQLYQRYAGVGTEVEINRDAAESKRLRAGFAATHRKEHAITDGKELLAGAAAGRLPKPVG